MRAKKTKVTDVEEGINQATPEAVVTAQPPMAQVSARFSVPVSQLAGGQFTENVDIEMDDTGFSEDDEEPEYDSRTEYIQQRLNEERVKAYIYRVPDSVIRSNNIPDRLPKNAARLGYVACGNFAFNPETWEDDLRERVYDGAYFVIVKEAGKFGGIEEFIIVENTPKSAELKLTAAPGAPAPQYNPYQNIQIPDQGKATKDAITMLTQVANLQRELTGGYTPPKPVKEKTLLEQMTELKALNELMAPSQAQQQTDPLLRMVELAAASNKPDLMTLVIDRMLGGEDDAPSNSFWQEFAMAIAPAINELAPSVGNLLQNIISAPQPVPAPPSVPTRQLAQPQAIPPKETPASQPPPQPSIPVGAEQELIVVGDRMIQALANNTDAEEIAELYMKLEVKFPDTVTPIINALIEADATQLLQQWAAAPGLEKLTTYPHAVEWIQKLQAAFDVLSDEVSELEEGNEMQKLLDDLIAAYERNGSIPDVADPISKYAKKSFVTRVFIKSLLAQSNEKLLETIGTQKPELLKYEWREEWLNALRKAFEYSGVFE